MDLTIEKIPNMWEIFFTYPVTLTALLVLVGSLIFLGVSQLHFIRSSNRVHHKGWHLADKIRELRMKKDRIAGVKKHKEYTALSNQIADLEAQQKKLLDGLPDYPKGTGFAVLAIVLSVLTLFCTTIVAGGDAENRKIEAITEVTSSEIERVYGIEARDGDIGEMLTGKEYAYSSVITASKYLTVLDISEDRKIFQKYHDTVLMLPNGELTKVTLIRIADEYKLVFTDNTINEVEYTELSTDSEDN